jgi:hypothetical protein
MGIEVSYERILPGKFADIQNNPKLAKEFFHTGDSSILGSLLDMMQGNSIQDSNKILENLYQNEASVYEGYSDTTKTRLSLEKEWQAIHYLLTGEISFEESQSEPILGKVVMGGTPTKFEAAYGFVKYFDSNEIKEISKALDLVSREDLRAKFDARGDRKIYAQGEWDEEEWEMLLCAIDAVTCFFKVAATNDEFILISSD